MTAGPRTRPLVAALVVLSVAGAVIAHLAIAGGRSPTLGAVVAIAPLAAIAFVAVRRARGRLLPVLALLVAAGTLWAGWGTLERHFPHLYFLEHVGSNLLLGAMFGRTLAGGREPLCGRFARLIHGAALPPAVDRYTRQVTVAWTAFFLVLAALSAGLYFAGRIEAWSILANFLTLPLVAAMFLVEYAVRLRVLPDWRRGSILDGVRAFWRHSTDAPSQAPR